jgi:hypothetical protein
MTDGSAATVSHLRPPAGPGRRPAVAPDASPAARVCAELAGLDLAQVTLSEMARRVAALAHHLVPAACDASVTVLDGRRFCTVAFAGRLGAVLDERQYGPEYGPGMTALATGLPVDVPDTSRDDAHAEFGRQAARHGVTSAFAVPVPIGHDAMASLTLYASGTTTLDRCNRDVATDVATGSAVMLANVLTYAAAVDLAAQLREAMMSRSVIEQAKGMIMAERRCSADAAFAILREASVRSNRKVRDLAHAMVVNAQR